MPSISQLYRTECETEPKAGGEGVRESAGAQTVTHSPKEKISPNSFKRPPRNCLICRKPFQPDREVARFCCEKHQIEWQNSQPEHPVIPKVSAQHPRALELRDQRTQLCLLEKADPYTYGFIPDHWELANRVWAECSELLISGGNRAGKTLWAAGGQTIDGAATVTLSSQYQVITLVSDGSGWMLI